MPGRLVAGILLLCLVAGSFANPPKTKVVKKLVDRFALTCPITQLTITPTQPTQLSSESVLRHVAAFTGFNETDETAGKTGQKARLSDPSKIPFVDHRQHFFSCWDARHTYAILGTPGGDAAEFALALNAVEKTRPLSQAFHEDQVYAYLQAWVATRRFFYMHTDARYYREWARATGVPEPIKPGSEPERQEVIRLAPAFIGCDHFQNLLKYEVEYQSRRALTEAVIRSVIRLLTDKTDPLSERIQFAILDGHVHDEQALIAVHSPTGFENPYTQLPGCFMHYPLVVPHVPHSTGMKSAMVHHPRAVFELRAQLAEFFQAHEHQDDVWRDAIFKAMNDLGAQQALLTKEKTTKAPTYQAQFEVLPVYDEMPYPNPTYV